MTRQVVQERHHHPRRALHCLHSRVDEEEEEVVDEGGGEEEDEDGEHERAHYQLLHLHEDVVYSVLTYRLLSITYALRSTEYSHTVYGLLSIDMLISVPTFTYSLTYSARSCTFTYSLTYSSACLLPAAPPP